MSDQTYGVLLGASAATAFWVVAALLLLRGLDRTWRMAALLASRPSTASWASIKCHSRSMPTSDGIAVFMQLGRCWLCGTQRGRFQSYVIGPMCAINRVSGEPGSHLACAEYAVRACPFMVNPDRHRGEAHIPEGAYMSEYHNPANPGVNLIWTSRNGHPMRAPNGNVLFDIGHPEHVEWYCRGRPATHTESMNALLRGAAFLREQAQQEGDDARLALEAQIPVAMRLVPDA